MFWAKIFGLKNVVIQIENPTGKSISDRSEVGAPRRSASHKRCQIVQWDQSMQCWPAATY